MTEPLPVISETVEGISEVPTEKAIQTYALLEAKAKAELAALKTRLAMCAFRPSHLYPVILYNDGLRWVCEYLSAHDAHESGGINVVAYGMCPEEAMAAFDRLWMGGELAEEESDEEESDEEGCDEVI